MTYLLDTNILVRAMNVSDPEHDLVASSILSLRRRNEELVVCPQCLVEFWSVSTRPKNVNGFDLTPAEADSDIDSLLARFRLIEDTSAVFPKWRQLSSMFAVSGKQVHDARIVATAVVSGVGKILTLNDQDFVRYRQLVEPVHPSSVPLNPPVS